MNAPEDSPDFAETFLKGVWRENPVFVQVLGMCPTLAVTNSLLNSLTMGLATAAVLVASSFSVALVRKLVPRQVRIAVFILIIATFVSVADLVIQAVSLDIHRALGAFISLIVVNCVILGRAEAFAARNGPLASVLDAAGMGTGFASALLLLGAVRELFGNGSLAGQAVFGPAFQPWLLFSLPAGGFFALSGWLVVVQRVRAREGRKVV